MSKRKDQKDEELTKAEADLEEDLLNAPMLGDEEEEEEDDDDESPRKKRLRNEAADAKVNEPVRDSGVEQVDVNALQAAAEDAQAKVQAIEVSRGANGSAPRTRSKVLHLRNLPVDSTDLEMAQLCGKFGTVVSAMRLQGKSQGFVEMVDENAAEAVINGYGDSGALFRNKRVFFNFSNRDTITMADNVAGPDNDPSPVLMIIIQNQLYPITVDTLYTVFGRYPKVQKIAIFSKNGMPRALVQYETTEQAQEAKQHVDGKDIYVGCCHMRIKYSSLKELTVASNNQWRHDYVASPAQAAPPTGEYVPMQPPNPQQVQQMQMQMQSSHGQQQQQQQQGPMSHQPYGQQQQQQAQPYGMPPNQMAPYPGSNMAPAQQPPAPSYNPYPAPNAPVALAETQTPVIIIGGLIPDQMYPDHIYVLCKFYGDVYKVKILPHKKDNALVEFANTTQAQAAVCYLNGLPIGMNGRGLKVSLSKHKSLTIQQEDIYSKDFSRPSSLPNVTMMYQENPQLFSMIYTAPHASHNLLANTYYPNTDGFYYDYTTGQYIPTGGQWGAGGGGGDQGTPVVIVSNLVPGVVTPDQLFALFGLCGDVMRVKIMHNKQDTALIQFRTPEQARLAIQTLNECPMHNSTLRVNASRHQSVATPRPGAPESASNLTQDYSTSKAHRFAGGGQNHQVYPPSENLHVSGLAGVVTRDQLQQLFAPYGTVMNIRLHSDNRMAFVQMSNTNEAVTCLVMLDTHYVGAHRLRVSFAKGHQQIGTRSQQPAQSQPASQYGSGYQQYPAAQGYPSGQSGYQGYGY